MQHSISREQIINQTFIVYSDLYQMMASGKYLEVQEYIRDAHTALRGVVELDQEIARCQEAQKNLLVSEGTMLLMPKGGRGSLARRPVPPTPPTVS